MHSERFPTRLPGYPANFCEGLVPPAEEGIDPQYQLDGPQYDWNALQNLEFEKSQKDHVFKPIDPASMYVSCHSWVSYPYGIPDMDQPSPYCDELEAQSSSSATNTVTSITTQSDPTPQTIGAPSPKQQELPPPITLPQPSYDQKPPVHKIVETLMWTG